MIKFTRTRWVLFRSLGILSIIILFYMVLESNDGSAEILIDEPLLINETIQWNDSVVVINAPIRIAEGGELLIDTCNVEFNGTYSLEVGITVEPFGVLGISGSRNGSVLGTGMSGLAYHLRAYPDSNVVVSNTTISGLGTQMPIFSLWSMGNCIRSDRTIFRDCTIIDCYIGIGLEVGSDSLIERTSFIGCIHGIWAFSVSNLSIIECKFTDCGDAIEAEKFYQSIGMSLKVSRTNFRNCSRSITFKGYELTVNDCNTIHVKRDILIMWARRFSISDHNSSDSDLSFRFVGVDEGLIFRTHITNCTTGIIAASSHISVNTTLIDKVSTAFEIKNSTIQINGVVIQASTIGIRCNDHEHRKDDDRLISINDVLFDDILTPLSISEASRVDISGCVFKGHRPTITCKDVGEFRFYHNEAIVNGLTLKFSGLKDGEVSMDAYSGVFLTLDLQSTVLKYNCPDLDSTVVFFSLDGVSNVTSYIHPDKLNLSFMDRLSEFTWIKEVSFNILKSSDGSPARGFDTLVMDRSQSIILDIRVGQSGIVRVGDVPLLTLGYQRSSVLTPHTLEVTNNRTMYHFEIDLVQYDETHLVLTVVVDDMPPVIELTTPSDGGEYRGPTLLISGHATDEFSSIQSVVIILNDGKEIHVNSEWSFTVELESGWHHMSVISTDDHFNIGVIEIWFLVSEPTAIINISQPLNGTITNETMILINGRLTNGTWLTLNSEWVLLDIDGCFIINYSLVEGTNRFQFESSNNLASEYYTLIVIRDTKKPDVDLYDLPNITRNRTVTLTGKVIDSNPPDSIWVGGVDTILHDTQSFSIDIVLSEGVNLINISVEDLAGNTWSQRISIERDSILNITLLENPPVNTEQEFLTLRLHSEEKVVITVYRSGVSVGNYSFFKGIIELVVYLRIGSNPIQIVAADNAGNTASINTTVIREEYTGGPSDPVSSLSWMVISILVLVLLLMIFISWRILGGASKS